MKVVYVDFDGTLVRSNSFHYIYFCLRQKVLKTRSTNDLFWYLVWWLGLPFFVMLHKINDSWRDRVTYWFYRGLKQDEIEGMARQYFQARPHLVHGAAVRYLHAKSREGYLIVIVSGSFQEILRGAVDVLGLSSVVDDCLATRLEYKDTIASGRILGAPMVRQTKATAVDNFEKGRTVEDRISISDSSSDLALLELARTAIVVNPSRQLKQLAVARSWDIWEI